MAGFWKRTLTYLGLDEEDGGYEEFEEEDDDFEQSPPTVRKITRYPDLDRVRKTASLRTVPVAPPQAKVHIVEPRNFNDCQQIADKFKADVPVIINMQLSDAELGKRLIDFASGLTYGLDGGMQRIADKVFLLTPSSVEVSAEEKKRLREKGFFNQL